MRKIIILLIVILIFLGVLQFFLSGNVSASIKELNSIEKQIEEKIKENNELSRQIAVFSSLQRIEKEAERLGFIFNCPLIDYSSLNSIALR